ncbi:unnamed protein product [Sphagnum jensenii]|uniref:Uncharacterized protein n=1 Tax=Sphagnum jensenii TaxID=128206 RepID=A0ABP1ATM7_9BRYO
MARGGCLAKEEIHLVHFRSQVKSDPPTPPNSSTEALATTVADPSPEQLHQPLIVRNDSSPEGLDMAVNSTNL